MRYFTSDLHFFDHMIITYCNRPYDSVDSMNNDLAKRFSISAGNASEVYILGDILGSDKSDLSLAHTKEAMEMLGIRDLPFHLVLGNHDHLTERQYLEIGFKTVSRLKFIEIDGRKVMLTHDPCMVQPRNTLAMCGHIHTLFSENYQPLRNTLAVNVSVEVRDYKPLSELDFIKIAASYNF